MYTPGNGKNNCLPWTLILSGEKKIPKNFSNLKQALMCGLQSEFILRGGSKENLKPNV